MASYREEINSLVNKRRSIALDAAFTLFSQRSIEEVNMTDIAAEAELGVASLYRYFGTKLNLCIELASLKWDQYMDESQARYKALDGEHMTAIQEFEFYLDSYVDLYDNHKELLRFNSNFDLYTTHEGATAEELSEYYSSLDRFSSRFHVVYEKASADHTMRTDIAEEDLFFSVMYTMLTTAQKLAYGQVLPRDAHHIHLNLLSRQKEMFLAYVAPQNGKQA